MRKYLVRLYTLTSSTELTWSWTSPRSIHVGSSEKDMFTGKMGGKQRVLCRMNMLILKALDGASLTGLSENSSVCCLTNHAVS